MYIKSSYPEVPPVPEINIHDFLFHDPDKAETGDYTLHIDPVTGRKRSYYEFLARVRDGATALGTPVSLGGLGLSAGDGEIIGIIGENSSDYIILVHSLLAITTPFALISSYSTSFELRHALGLSKVTRLFVDARYLPSVLSVAKEAGLSLRRIYILEGRVKGHKSISDLIDEARSKGMERVSVRPATKETLAYLVFSSGTSGLPKAVMISHGNINFSLAQSKVVGQAAAEVYTPPTPKTPEGIPIILAFLPLHHSYGLFAYCFRSILPAQSLVILNKWDVGAALKVIPKYHVTALTLIPSVVHQLVNYPNIHQADFSSLLSMSCGAAYLPLELANRFVSLAPQQAYFSEGYGMSEATIGAVTQPYSGILGGRVKHIPGSTGILLPGMEAHIVREDGTDANVNETGEMYLRGSNVALGYWNNQKASNETFVDGWLRTGDRFRVDEEGHFFYADRAKDTLKVSGVQVSPLEIENVLLSHPKKLITDVTVAGVSGGRTSDEKVPRAWVVLSDSGKKLGVVAVIEQLNTWHRVNLSKYKWLRGGIEVVKEVPKSPTGKTLRRVFQNKYEEQVAQSPKGNL